MRDTLLARFARGAGWNTAAMGFTVAANFSGSVIFARILGQQAFGAYGIVQSTMMTTVALSSQFGNAAVNRYVSQYRRTDPARAGRIIGLNLLGAGGIALLFGIILAGIAPIIARRVFDAPELTAALLIAAAAVPLMNINGATMSALAGFEAFKRCAKISLTGGIAYLAVGAAGAYMFGVPGALLGWLGGLGTQIALSYRGLLRTAAENGVRVQYRGATRESDSIMRFNLPAMLAGLTPLSALWIGQMLIVRRADGFADMALFSAAYTIRSAVIMLPYVFYTVTLSVLNSYHGEADTAQFRRTFWLNVAATMSVAFVASAFLALLSPWVLSAFGKGFVDGREIVLILLCGAVLEATWVAVHQIVQARELLWRSLFLVTLPRDILIAGCALTLVPHFGARGLAWSYVSGWTFALIATSIIALHAGIKPQSQDRPLPPAALPSPEAA